MASNDPILTPLLISAGVTGSLEIGTVTIGFAPVLSSLIVAGGLIGISALLQSRPGPRPSDGTAAIQQAIPPRAYIVGTVRKSGSYLYFTEYLGDLYVVLAVFDGEYDEIERWYLNDDLINFSATGTAGPPKSVKGSMTPGVDGRYGPIVTLAAAFGVHGITAFPDFLGTGSDYPAAFYGTGITMAAMLCKSVPQADFLKRYPNGKPDLSLVLSALGRWDPRDDAQDPADPSTWTASTKNLALNWLWYECFCAHGPRRDYTKAILPYIDIWKEEADICDEPVATKGDGAPVARYEIGYWWQADTAENSVRAMFIACSDGWCCNLPDGGFIIRVGKYRAPTVTLTDDDIRGFYLKVGQAVEDRVNELVVKYTSPDHDYGEVEADPIRDEDQIADDGRILSSSVDLWGVQALSQARRLGMREWNRSNEPLGGSLECNLGASQAIGQRWLRVQSQEIPRLTDEVIEVRKLGLDVVAGRIVVDWLRSGPQIDTYDPDDPDFGDGDDPVIKTKATNLTSLPVPDNILVEAGDSPPGSQFDVSWDETPRKDLDFQIRYRIIDVGGGTPGPWLTQSFSELTADAGRYTASIVLPTADSYELQVASIGPGGALSEFGPDDPLPV